MIILSGVLVVVAFVLLIAGIVAGDSADAQVLGVDARMVIYASIGVSIASALCLIIGVFLRRRELFGVGASPARTRSAGRSAKKTKDRRPAGRKGTRKAAAPAADATPAATVTASSGKVPDEALVHVVPGRKRYHLASCRQVAGRSTEELTYIEAKEEGFSPCTACMPDTALAARAAVSSPPAAEDAGPAKGKRQEQTAKTAKNAEAGQKAGAQDKATGQGDQPSGADTASGGTTAVLSKPDTSERPRPDEPAAPAAPAPAAPSQVPSAWSPPASSSPSGRPGPATPLPRPAVADQPVPEQARPEPSGAAGSDPQVCILSGTKRFHRTDCSLIEDIGDTEDLETLPLSQAQDRGCTPCLVCQPDKVRSGD